MKELETRLASSPDGISKDEAQKRLEKYGYNELTEKKNSSFLKFLSYFWGPIPIMIMIAAAFISSTRPLAGCRGHSGFIDIERNCWFSGRIPGWECHCSIETEAGGSGQSQTGWNCPVSLPVKLCQVILFVYVSVILYLQMPIIRR